MTDEQLLSNLSYVNKDFQSIYEELLDYTKKISYKWDPSVSNESDPGVVLIKEMALCTDKNNYNTDKTGLETFPVSVTQEANARNLFSQLGYNMSWYKAGTTEVSMRWIGDISSETAYKIPRFTAVSDEENKIVYTITDERSLSGDGAIMSFSAIQGSAVEYDVNGETLITVANLDANNRLYFNRRNVAENGVFICNADSESSTGKQDNFDEWVRVDNLFTAYDKDDSGDLIRNYSFGVSDDGNSCYIEFPQNATEIFEEGIYITYILTDGEDGNIVARELSKFFSDVVIPDPADESSSIKLSTENVFITNVSSVRNGADPETINSAYRNYKKTTGTFDTLVSLRDYTNAINTSEIVSNSFVCDRTNDIQSSYSVVTKTADGVEKKILYIEQDENENPLITAFDLKLYALQKVDRPDDASEYDTTFAVIPNQEDNQSADIDLIKSYIDSKKSVQHDFDNLLPDRIVLFKNKYNIDCKIIPQYRITSLQENDIAKNIRQALFDRFNASQVDFGEEVTFAEVYDTILAADVRIKAIALNNIEFATYAVYYNSSNGKYEEVLVNEINSNFYIGYYNSVDGKFYEDAEYTTEISTVLNSIYYDLNDNIAYIKTSDGLVSDYATNFMIEIFAKSVLNGTTQLLVKDSTITYDITQNYVAELNDVAVLETNVIKQIGDGTTSEAVCELKENEAIQLYAPSLIDDTQYSTYIRYECELTVPAIPANSDYKLQNNESIIFYWRDTDDSESDYRYHYYEEGAIIRPSFTLKTAMADSNAYTYDIIKNAGKPSEGTTENLTISTGSYSNAPLTTYISQELSGSSTSLSGTKTITTRKINKADLDSTLNKCYWHLNNKVNGKFELFPANDGSKQTYTLKSNELFLYTNQEETELLILGEGTKIMRVSNTDPASAMPAWVCEPYSLEDIQEDGASALENKWQSISSLIDVSVQEMQMITLNEGDQFKVTANSGNVDIELDSSTVSFTGYSLAYSPKDGSGWVNIPNVNLGEDDSWEGNSVLNFVASYDSPQKLITDQFVTAYVFDYTTGEIDPTGIEFEGGEGTSAIYLRPDIPYDMPGGIIDVSRLETSGETTYMTLYAYHPTEEETKEDGSVEVEFTGPITSGDSVTLDAFKVPAGKYILPLQNTRSDITSLSVEIQIGEASYVDVLPIYGGDGDLSEAGTYYLSLDLSDISDSDECVLRVNCATAATGNIIFKLLPLYRYIMPDNISSDSAIAIMNKMFELDRDNHYDYTYQVDRDIAIDNPLSANSFENINHIFNAYTICQMNNKGVTLDITNKIK